MKQKRLASCPGVELDNIWATHAVVQSYHGTVVLNWLLIFCGSYPIAVVPKC